MSARNGDKSRFGRNRKKRIAQRARDRALRQAMHQKSSKTSAASAEK